MYPNKRPCAATYLKLEDVFDLYFSKTHKTAPLCIALALGHPYFFDFTHVVFYNLIFIFRT